MTRKQFTFLKTRGQPRVMLSWKTAVILSLGSMLLVTVSLGSMAGEIGLRTIFVWGITAFVGVLICLLVMGIGFLLVFTCIPLHLLSKHEHTMFWKDMSHPRH